MLKLRIIACLDVKNGRVVKGVNFINLRDAGDAIEQAKLYSAGGADELCFLDISASTENRSTLYNMVSAVAENCSIPFTVGGGVRSVEDIRRLLLAGADKVGINTAAVSRPELVREASEKFGSQCIVVSIDAKLAPNGYEIFTHGGRDSTGINAIKWAKKMEEFGAGELLVTSMDRDGTGEGFNIELTKAIVSAVNIPVIASGGVGKIEHFIEGCRDGGADAVLAASVFHFGKFTIKQVKESMRDAGLPVRLYY